MKVNQEIIFAYLLGWIEMLDAYQRAKGVDEKQRFLKKNWVLTKAIETTLPNLDPAEVNAFLKEMGELKPEGPLIDFMQKKVTGDQMQRAIIDSGIAKDFANINKWTPGGIKI